MGAANTGPDGLKKVQRGTLRAAALRALCACPAQEVQVETIGDLIRQQGECAYDKSSRARSRLTEVMRMESCIQQVRAWLAMR